MQCNKTLKAFHDDEFLKFLYSDEGVYFFCNKDCKDKWSQSVVTEEDIGKLRQYSI